MPRSQFLRMLLAAAFWPAAAAVFGGRAGAQGTPGDIAGRIVRLKGAATAMQDAQPRVLKEGDAILRGDVISTGRGARLEMKMLDDAVMTLGEKTVFVVIDYTVGGSAPNAATRLIEGAFAATAGTIPKSPGGTMRIETDVATIGIRGTTVWGGMLDGDFQVALLAPGLVVVENRAGRTELGRNGEGTLVKGPAVAPTSARAWPREKQDRARASVAFD